MKSRRIFSIGHLQHTMSHFLSLLTNSDIICLLDVRRFPGSRRHPQFNEGELRKHLLAEEIDYVWLGETLGGKRAVEYTEHMKSQSFQWGIADLQKLASTMLTVFMCSENDYRNCHRRFIADALTRKGWTVYHILGNGQIAGHLVALL